ncbi:hypothetical protein ABW21_db0206732 [Orbilia brochopaga]|nr:hypothetical protein ABW21_db0206732 [Drechslerella brochopaga]
MPATRSRSAAKRVADDTPEPNGRSSVKRAKSTANGNSAKASKANGAGSSKGKKAAIIQGQDAAMIKKSFRKDLFSDTNVTALREFHERSEPYQHCVINDVVSNSLLRAVRAEIMENIHFTPKQTDIYTIYQSGDLVNISGLTEAERKLLPRLWQLRDALYSPVFRSYIEHITDCGKLSGSKVDMAINVYTKGCHLLCHDDVIGTRCVSYILYLTDPEDPWQPSWGGGLRLYPTNAVTDAEGKGSLIPTPDWSLVIPPAANQLACFVVQPGKSFHDVEEVFVDGKARMAISGWFHIPEKGEDGYIEGREKELAEQSSMKVLEKNLETHDSPKASRTAYPDSESKDQALSSEDIEFLKKYINLTYLEEKSLKAVTDRFAETKNVQLLKILDAAFADKLKAYIENLDGAELAYDGAAVPTDTPDWKVSGPPYKQRFLYSKPDEAKFGQITDDMSPLDELSHVLLPSTAFRKLLAAITGKVAVNRDIIARRFRPGLDYTLGLGQEDETPRLEVVLSLTPTTGGWDVPLESEDALEEDDNEEEDGDESVQDEGDDDEEIIIVADEDSEGEGNNDDEDEDQDGADEEMSDDETAILDNWGGYEIYMSTADKPKHPRIDDPKAKNKTSTHELDDSYDPAIVSTAANSGDDELMLHLPATWNSMNVIYRDTGVMRFTKYVSRAAAGSRWDVGGVYQVE